MKKGEHDDDDDDDASTPSTANKTSPKFIIMTLSANNEFPLSSLL